jgi:hypothetical protein
VYFAVKFIRTRFKRDKARLLQAEDPLRTIDLDHVPNKYNESRHFKYFLKHATAPAVIGVMAVVFAFLSISGLYGFAGVNTLTRLSIVFVCAIVICISAFLVVRHHWIWINWHIHADPVYGQVVFTQPDNRLLFVKGSSNDPYDMSQYTLYTPLKTWLELYIFRSSQTLALFQGNVPNSALTRRELLRMPDGPPVFLDIKHVDQLLEIQKYRNALEQREERHSRSMVQLLEQSVANQDTLMVQNERIIELLSMVADVEYRSPASVRIEDTTEL